jgi:hypothetical protein
MEAKRSVGPAGRIFLVAANLALITGPAPSAEKEAPPPPEKEAPSPPKKVFLGLARLGPAVRGELGVFEATLYSRDEKGKTVNEKAILEVPSELPILVDGKVPIEDLTAGDTAFILGREVDREVQSKSSKSGDVQAGRDRQIQNARAILAGQSVEVNEAYREGRDKSTQWHKTEVKMSGFGLWVKFKDHEYRVTLERTAPILKRTRGERKVLKAGSTFLVKAEEGEAGADAKKAPAPGGKAAAKTARLTCKLVVLIDTQQGKVYEAVLP